MRPYVLGLARRGFEIEFLSHEPAGQEPVAHRRVKVWDSGRVALLGLVAALQRLRAIVHA